jgi:ABC-2 type transport system ATP-binding protein
MAEMALQWSDVIFAVRHGFWMKFRVILKNIDLDVPEGKVIGLVGPNGAGKTTTIKLGAGLLQPESGKVLIHGRPAAEAGARSCLGLLTESQYVYPHLRLKEWLIMMAGLSGLRGERRTQRVNDVLDLLDLTGQSSQMMRTLSKGQVQRAGLAQALVHEPAILLLDEPMSGLDPYWRYRIQRILLDFKGSGGTILFSSHILVDVERLSDRVALMEGGRVRWTGSLSDLPRKIKGYEAICRTEQPELLRKLASGNKVEVRPEGGWIVPISSDKREELLNLASGGTVTLDSLRPIREEIEEVLFSFTSGSETYISPDT